MTYDDRVKGGDYGKKENKEMTQTDCKAELSAQSNIVPSLGGERLYIQTK